MNWFDSWALTLTVLIPAVGALVVMLVPRTEEASIKWIALLATLAPLAVTVGIMFRFKYSQSSRLQFDVNKHWIDVINSHYHVAVDGISLPMLVLSVFITVLCVIYSWNHFPEPHNPKAFLALILILEVGMNGTFIAQDLILFFVFFEIVLLPMFFMIGVWGGPNRQYAVDQVLLVHAVRFGPDAARVPRPLLQGQRESGRRRPAQLRHGPAHEGSWSRSRQKHPRPDLRRPCSSASRSRCRCSRSIRGCPTPTPRRRPSARCSSPRSC